MPSPRYIPAQPDAFADMLTNFGKNLGEGTQRNYQQAREDDQMSEMLKDYQPQSAEEAVLINMMRTRGVPLEKKKSVADIIQHTQNIVAKSRVAKEKLKTATDQDERENLFLDTIQGKNLSPTELYIQARKAGVERVRAKEIASLQRMDGREERLTLGDVKREYDFELRDLDKRIKDTLRPSERKPLEEERKRIKAARERDVQRYRKGDRNFQLSMHERDEEEEDEEADESIAEQVVEQPSMPSISNTQDPSIVALTAALPPEQNKGVTKYSDKTGKAYTSDGKQWILSDKKKSS